MKKPQKLAFLMIRRNREAISRKAQGLPINTIIIAILAIAVLFLLMFLFIRKGGEFGKATTDCQSLGGTCVNSCTDIPSGIPVSGTCAGQGQVCCRSALPQDTGT